MLRGVELWKQPKELMCAAGSILRERRWLWLAMLGVTLIGCGLILPHDLAWHHAITAERLPALRDFAFQVSRWGDYETGTLIIAAGLWLAGLVKRRTQWKLAGLACLLAASLGGCQTNCIRYALGRPRPHAAATDTLQGPTLKPAFHSFPSGHSTTSFATAGALAVALPPVGVPFFVGACGVVWSRLYLGAHYPADVWAGAWIGLFNGLVLGLAVRRCCSGNKPADASTTSPPHPDR